jgi:hypothetical protein
VTFARQRPGAAKPIEHRLVGIRMDDNRAFEIIRK